MKRKLILGLIILFALNPVFQANAQKDKTDKGKKVSIQIVKEENGKKNRIDTTFTLNEGEDLDKVLQKYGIDSKSKAGNFATFDVRIENGDSSKNMKEEKIVIISSDGDERFKKVYVTGDDKKKKVMITEDSDFAFFGDDGETFIEINEGDTGKQIRKIVRTHRMGPGANVMVFRKPGAPRHFRMPRTFHFYCDSMEMTTNAGSFSGNDSVKGKRFIIKELRGDSMDVTIKSEFNDQFDHMMVMPDFDFDFQIPDVEPFHGNFMHPGAKVMIKDPSEEDLNGLKLQSKYKSLDLKEFMLTLNGFGAQLGLSFKTPEKGDLSIKITDKKGNEFLVVELKDFQGKFEKEFRIPRGEHLLYISQNKKFFVKKLLIE